MAYRQQHDPYANAYPDQPPAAPNYTYPQQPAPQQHYQDYAQPAVQQNYAHPDYVQQEYDPHAAWETKSTKSYQSSYAGSQAHLNPHEMTQVAVPPMPAIPYQQPMGNYPPQQRPGMLHAQSSQSSAGWSTAKEKLMKRRSVRQVELQQGNLVLDMQVPSHIVPKGMDNIEEMTKLRYTAATCDPDDFMREKYSLRPYLLGRRTELFIVMTMYNEDEVLFTRTMNAYAVSRFCIDERCRLINTLSAACSRTSRTCAAGTSQRCGVLTAGRRSSSAWSPTAGARSTSVPCKS